MNSDFLNLKDLKTVEKKSPPSPTAVMNPNLQNTETKPKNRRFIFGLIAIFLLIIFSLIFLFSKDRFLPTFYEGRWNAEVNENLKNAGMQGIILELSPDKVVTEVNLKQNLVSIHAKSSTSFKETSRLKNQVFGKRTNPKIDLLEINVDPSLCPDDAKKCDQIKQDAEKDFRNKFVLNEDGKEHSVEIKKINEKEIEFYTDSSKIILTKREIIIN